jgi:phosphoglycerol transferase
VGRRIDFYKIVLYNGLIMKNERLLSMKNNENRPLDEKIYRILGNGLLWILLFVAFLGFFAACWYVVIYGRIGFDSVIYTLTGGLNGVSTDLLEKFLVGALLPAVVCSILAAVLLLRPWPWKRWISVTVSILLSLGLLTHAAFNVELVAYILNSNRTSDLYESEYRDPNTVSITFPEEKRNLIYIYMESMETSYLSQDLGGGLEYNLIPELTELAQDNINFSHNEYVGGFRQVTGASWTIGAMVAHTGGVPLKVPDGIEDWQNGYGQDGEFLDGLTSITSILEREGYNQALMVGSWAVFGGRDTYYNNHGVDWIWDLISGREEGLVAPNYWNDFWGFEDLYLYEYAKYKLTLLSEMEEPFAFTMLTVDTHHIGGFTCDLCGTDYEESYENAIRCASRQLYDFIDWIKQQDFYENTTIVITGDHCSMDNGYFSRNVDKHYDRHIYNCFINAAAQPFRTNHRQFCAMDMFPTTLAAMGCKIQGDRLGLGTNLFSTTPTLMERIGFDRLCLELGQKSEYYENNFYGKKPEETTP